MQPSLACKARPERGRGHNAPTLLTPKLGQPRGKRRDRHSHALFPQLHRVIPLGRDGCLATASKYISRPLSPPRSWSARERSVPLTLVGGGKLQFVTCKGFLHLGQGLRVSIQGEAGPLCHHRNDGVSSLRLHACRLSATPWRLVGVGRFCSTSYTSACPPLLGGNVFPSFMPSQGPPPSPSSELPHAPRDHVARGSLEHPRVPARRGG